MEKITAIGKMDGSDFSPGEILSKVESCVNEILTKINTGDVIEKVAMASSIHQTLLDGLVIRVVAYIKDSDEKAIAI